MGRHAAAPRSIFLDRPKTTTFTCHITDDLQGRIKSIQDTLKQDSGTSVFPLDQIVEDALQRAVQAAESELAHRNGGKATKSAGTSER